ncbi:hypothetical protein PV04_08853 [Phialophora macrospora]|uniref:Uncharacterized protein n=1 Tax=Phialophora macrospora TaxID=1851006 RepID=A0A0D2F7B7_9EURO|nr:hypothetical protein PV04_08853 [Phialophora macrospora]
MQARNRNQFIGLVQTGDLTKSRSPWIRPSYRLHPIQTPAIVRRRQVRVPKSLTQKVDLWAKANRIIQTPTLFSLALRQTLQTSSYTLLWKLLESATNRPL